MSFEDPEFVEAIEPVAETFRALNAAMSEHGATPSLLRMAAASCRTTADHFEKLADRREAEQ